MDEPQRIVMPDSIVTGLAAENAAGPIYMTSLAKDPGSELPQTTLSAVDLSGKVRWRRLFSGHAGVPRALGGGGVWLARHEPDGTAVLEETSPDGSPARAIRLSHHPDEKLGEVVVLPDGFCTAWTSGPPYRGARVDRRGADGACIWSAVIPPDQLAHDCIMEASADTGWRSQRKLPWIPKTFQLHHWEPLLVSGDRILASYREGKTGLGISYFVDAETGEIIKSTKPAPIGHKAVLGSGEFLIGAQGYDEFVTIRYTRAGDEASRWPTHGATLVDRASNLLGVEFDNRATAQPRVRLMEPDGSLTDGPVLAGRNSGHPALDRDGTAVLWRNRGLLTIDAGHTVRELLSQPKRASFISRTLLLEDGIVALGLDSELLICRTALVPLEDSVWPCGDGNLNGNPVAFEACAA
jgi:hypothetical protein